MAQQGIIPVHIEGPASVSKSHFLKVRILDTNYLETPGLKSCPAKTQAQGMYFPPSCLTQGREWNSESRVLSMVLRPQIPTKAQPKVTQVCYRCPSCL